MMLPFQGLMEFLKCFYSNSASTKAGEKVEK